MSGETTIIAPEVGAEEHCRQCRAVLRYCPGHKFDDQWRRLRGGKYASMMPPAPGIVARPGSPGRMTQAGAWGYFHGDPAARWSPDGERMHLLEPFTYTDRMFHEWTAPRGSVLDGASIPRAFWTLVGSPYRGKYRYASIIHDYHCVAREEPWDSVHYMFYGACMAAGTSHTHARILYYAVLHFGPRWTNQRGLGRVDSSAKKKADPMRDQGLTMMPEELGEVLRVERWIVDNDPTPEEIAGTPPEAIGYPRNKPKRR